MSSPLKNRPTVLVVEDECLVRLDAAQTLREAGFAVVEAANADEALAVVARGEDVDLLFTDINMPGPIDGLELARRVCRLRPRVHLLVTSGKVRPARGQIPDEGVFIPKPYSSETVARTVSAMLA